MASGSFTETSLVSQSPEGTGSQPPMEESHNTLGAVSQHLYQSRVMNRGKDISRADELAGSVLDCL